MTVAENLAFGLKRRNFQRAEIEQRISAVAEKIGLTPYLDRRPHALSGGQRQRVALGRAIVRKPKVFLFDEPLSNLDAALRASTRTEIARLHRELGSTMIYVTHDQVEAMTMGSRICIMNGGQIAQVGAPLDVYNRPADTFVASFLGNPAMNLLPGHVAEDGDGRTVQVGAARLTLTAGRSPVLAQGTDVMFGIRPEHVQPALRSQTSPTLDGLVTSVERLGAETLVTLSLPGLSVPLLARLSGQLSLNLGAPLSLVVDLEHAHLFGADGRSLTSTF